MSNEQRPSFQEGRIKKVRKTSKFVRIFSYLVLMLVIILGIMVLMGVFKMAFPSLQIPLGVIIVGYGAIRLFMQIMKYKEEDKSEVQNM